MIRWYDINTVKNAKIERFPVDTDYTQNFVRSMKLILGGKTLFSFMLVLLLMLVPFQNFASEKGQENSIPEKIGQNSLRSFEAELDSLRINLNIPGISAAVVMDDQIVWSNGFGLADIGNNIEARDSTGYRIASVTKTYASTVIMMLVLEGKLDLHACALEYAPDLPVSKDVKVKHLLSHTSQYNPGSVFRYSGARFGYLEDVIVGATGKTFSDLFVDRILIPLKLENTAPSVWPYETEYPELTNSITNVYENLAKPYKLTADYSVIESNYIMGFMVAGGLVSTVHDMASYNIALDNGFFFDESTTGRLYSPAVSTDGKTLPYGLGWFSQNIGHLQTVWHYGWHPDAASSLIIKIPEKKLSFIILANSDMLSKPFSLHNGDVLNSPATLLFLKTFLPEIYSSLDLEEKAKLINKVTLRSSGKVPLMNVSHTILFYLCLVLFLFTLIFWPIRFILVTILRNRFISSNNNWGIALYSRIYLWFMFLLCFFLMGAFSYYPPLIYWHELPGWFDGVPLFQNLTLALPSLLVILSIPLIPITILAWIRNTWTKLHKIHFVSCIFALGLFLLLLNSWHLLGIKYYWKYFLFNL